jgi:hypothetical protein
MHSFKHIGGAIDSTPLSGNMRTNGSGEGLGGSENQSWNSQYRYMIAFSNKIDYISQHMFNAKTDLYYSKRVLSELTGLWLLFLGSPKSADMKDTTKNVVNIRLKTAELYLESGDVDRQVEIMQMVFVEILSVLKDGYTFKGSRAKVRIRGGVAGDIDELVGRK